MAITYKCKMCGGNLELTEGSPLAVCEYCGTQQTVPTADNEKKMTLFARAGRLLRACEFDRAAGVYESIVAEFPEEAEAYWGLVLCRYGIEYVDDPATGKKIPTCHRSSFDSVMQDSDFEQALENADPLSRKVYRSEAKVMEDLRRGIIEVSGKEEPYDIFICYKETDDNGERTLDSVLAQDVYDALTERGYRVFFSRISLEDKLGMEYEPYIFAALNSAKVMLAFGTDYEYYNAVWVKNEWSRFLALIARGEKKTLIPCYKNLDAYDMPKEFAKLQAQDMGKVGAVQDLLRGIEKILPKEKETESVVVAQVQSVASPSVESLYTRGMIFLEDKDWNKAKEYFNRALDIDPKNAACYLGLAMASYQVSDYKNFVIEYVNLQIQNGDYDRYIKFSCEEEKPEIEYVKTLFERETIRRANEENTNQNKKIRLRLEKQKREEHKKRDEDEGNKIKRRENGRNIISAGGSRTVGLRADGTVVALGDTRSGKCNVSDWTDIVSVVAGETYTAGLRVDGTVVIVGGEKSVQDDVRNWKDIVSISVGEYFIVGLKIDGTVVAAGNNRDGQCDVKSWNNIISIAAGYKHTIGLKSNGTVIATGNNEKGQCNVMNWNEVIAISAGYAHTVGLKSDGSVIAVGSNEYYQCDVKKWKNIVAISAGHSHTLALKSDKTTVAVGANYFRQSEVEYWTNIIQISAGNRHSVGVSSDGRVVAIGANDFCQCDVQRWMILYDKKALNNNILKNHIERIDVLTNEELRLKKEISNLQGFFAESRREEIKNRLRKVEMELKKEENIRSILRCQSS